MIRKKSELPVISEAEFEVMKIVWKYKPISTNDVVDKLVGVTEWSPKTIQTMLNRLVKKKALSYYKEGRVYVYTPLVEEEEYRNIESQSFLDRFYDGAFNSMAVNFLKQEKLTDQEIDELLELLQSRKKGE